jgi:hypothetical protein
VLFLLGVHKCRSQVARATKARSVAPIICVSSVRSVLCFFLLAPRIVKWLLLLFLEGGWGKSCTRVLGALKAVNDFVCAFCISLKGRFVLEWGIGEDVEGRGRGLF